MIVEPCQMLDIMRYFEAAKQEHISFIKDTDFYCARIDTQIVGFCGVVWKSTPIFKNDYVLPAYRGRGVATEMLSYRLALAKERGYKRVRANTNPKSTAYYLKQGFTILVQYKNNAIVVKDLA